MKSHSKLCTGFALVCVCLIAVLLPTSCKKKSKNTLNPTTSGGNTTSITNTVSAAQINTIYPGPYLPAYPGSYWIYEFKKGSTGTYSIGTSSGYILDSVNIASFTTAKYIKAIVPYYNGQPLWKNKSHAYDYSDKEGLRWLPFVSDSTPLVGEKSEIRKYNHGAYYYRIVFKADTSITVNGKIYNHVMATRDYIAVNSIYYYGTDTYYAKDVGLIAEHGYQLKPTNLIKPTDLIPADSSFYIFELKEYFINK
ncbi:MAG: hypothetical protein IT236_08925 [Bacteroidia bacterium]|nr:hypothetical protein [Bacteroidia bacterium]